jgi:hypothetical protein
MRKQPPKSKDLKLQSKIPKRRGWKVKASYILQIFLSRNYFSKKNHFAGD